MKKIYKKTFIRESEQAIAKIDDNLALVEEGITELHMLLRKLTKGNVNDLYEQSKSSVSFYEGRLDRMSDALSDLYSLKNELLNDLERMSRE